MNIAIIVWKFPAESNTFVAAEINELLDLGVNLDIYSLTDPSEIICSMYSDLLKKLEGRVHYVRRLLSNRDMKAFYKRLELIDSMRLTTESHKSMMRDSLEQAFYNNSENYAKKLIEKISKKEYDHIYSPFGNWSADVAMFLSRSTGVDYSFSVHAQDLFCSYNFSKIKKETASNIFAVTDFNKNYLIKEKGVPENKVKIKRVNYQHISPRSIKAHSLPYDYIFTAARIDEMKGFEYSLQAFLELINNGHDQLKYLIAGTSTDKNYEKKIKNKIKKMNLSSHVLMLGMISNSEVQRYIKGAAFTILTSICLPNGDTEGLPTFLVESMNLGVPAIATNLSGIPEIIEEDKTGFLVNEKDQKDINSKTFKMLDLFYNNKKVYTQMSRACKKKKKDMYNNKKNAQILVDSIKT